MSESNEFSDKREDLISLNSMLSQTGSEKKSSKQVVVEGKLSQLLKFQQNFMNNQMKRINEKYFVIFNSNLIRECRNICIKQDSNLDKNEKSCLKNCMSKYYREMTILKKIEGEIINDYGPDIFILEEDSKNNMNEVFNLIEKKKSEIIQSGLKV